jgi:hypothetical protein
VLLNDYGAQSGSLSIPVDPKGYNWKEVGESLGPNLYWTIGGGRCGSSLIPDIIRIRRRSWMGYLGSDQGLLDINFPHPFSAPCLCSLFLPLAFAPCLCPLSLHPVFAPCLLGEIVCVTNEICLCQVDGSLLLRLSPNSCAKSERKLDLL